MITMKGRLIIAVAVIAVLGFGGYRWRNQLFPTAQPIVPSINVAEINKKLDSAASNVIAKADLMAKLLQGTNKAELVSDKVIPPISVVSAYDKSTKNGKPLVIFPINVWPGWAPIIMANNGMAANEDSIFYKQFGFYVELSIVDDPVKARDLFASGHSHVLWGTLDMFAMFAPALCKDSRTIPRIFQQIDWSSGGDGINARGNITGINDLRAKDGKKKKGVLAQNSPSHFAIMSWLLQAGIDPAEVDFRWTDSAPAAAKLFVQDESFDFFVGWSPDIYTVMDIVPGCKQVVTTASANHTIADTWAVRNDYYRDNPKIVEGLVEGIFYGMDMVRKDPARAAKFLAAAYNLPEADAASMIGKDGGIASGDAHLTNYRENNSFFLDPMNPANFESIWNRASTIYQSLGIIDAPVPAAKIKEPSILIKLAEKFKDVSDLSQPIFSPNMPFKTLEAGDNDILAKAVSIGFKAGKWDVDTNYDSTITATLVSIGEIAGTFGNAYIIIEGNTDGSMKGLVPADSIKKLSYDRADSVKNAIIAKYSQFDPNKFKVIGNGWENPMPGCTDQSDSDQGKANRKKNRRVEIKVYPLEAAQ